MTWTLVFLLCTSITTQEQKGPEDREGQEGDRDGTGQFLVDWTRHGGTGWDMGFTHTTPTPTTCLLPIYYLPVYYPTYPTLLYHYHLGHGRLGPVQHFSPQPVRPTLRRLFSWCFPGWTWALNTFPSTRAWRALPVRLWFEHFIYPSKTYLSLSLLLFSTPPSFYKQADPDNSHTPFPHFGVFGSYLIFLVAVSACVHALLVHVRLYHSRCHSNNALDMLCCLLCFLYVRVWHS